MRHNYLVYALLFVVVLVSGLNYFTVQADLKYFNQGVYNSSMEISREHQIAFCNEAVKQDQDTIHGLTFLIFDARQERDQLRAAYGKLYDKAIGLYQTAEEEEHYISLLTKALIAGKLDVPEMFPALVPADKIGRPESLYPDPNETTPTKF